ncbi:hypothetical protein [Vreelandella zhanjiangensis]|uniref:hypothetical protein n=1 Tax=Vreelandella zhanjiangensis TaxID=1121960 RepID=UPI0012DE24BC|nr:hypothetical protein [Halomonas zhanjiangensis]
MKKKVVISHRFQQAVNQGLRWHLDFPSLERPPWLNQNGWVVQGWVLLPDSLIECHDDVKVIARWSPIYELCHPLSLDRPDVIETVLEEDPAVHPQLCCGFRFTVPRHLATCTLELSVNGERISLPEANMPELTDSGDVEQPPLKVLEGKAGWLFLDNDTNGSVDQYRGRLLLTDKGVEGWRSYLSAFHALAERHAARHALLVAPSKESVMGPRYHPYEEGISGPIHQLLSVPEASNFVYPVEALKALGDDAFIQTDTHWASKGAMVAGKALLHKLELDDADVERVFANDDYQSRTIPGDLGSKFSPARACQTSVMCSFNYNKHRHFDNGLPNFGRLILINYQEALIPSTCLVFGSSSSYFLLSYLSRLFTHVVFAHTAGNLDPELVAAVKPQYLVVQTNARFVVQVPKANQALKDLIEEKRTRLTIEEREAADKRKVLAAKDDETIAALGLSAWVEL